MTPRAAAPSVKRVYDYEDDIVTFIIPLILERDTSWVWLLMIAEYGRIIEYKHT